MSAAHYYTADGRAAHNEGPSGGPTTIREARKLNLRPSVTTIQQIIAKSGLDIWIRKQWLLAALTLPRIDGESAEDFAKRVVADAEQQSKDARDEGTKIHGNLESGTGEHAAAFQAQLAERDLIILWQERVIVGPDYGGTVDLLCQDKLGQKILVDHKGQEWPDDKSPRFYSDWAVQLAAYAHVVKPDACASLVFHRKDPSRWEWKFWTTTEIENGWCVFEAAKTIWQIQKKYVPGVPA